VQELGRKLARQAKISEKDGERIARKLRVRSEKATRSLNRMLEKEVSAVVDALHAAGASHSSSRAKKAKPHRKGHGRKTAAKASHG
jgi:hypothetical protein